MISRTESRISKDIGAVGNQREDLHSLVDAEGVGAAAFLRRHLQLLMHSPSLQTCAEALRPAFRTIANES